jgi:hypothetical protein
MMFRSRVWNLGFRDRQMDHILGVLFNDDVQVSRPHTYVTYVHIYTKYVYVLHT